MRERVAQTERVALQKKVKVLHELQVLQDARNRGMLPNGDAWRLDGQETHVVLYPRIAYGCYVTITTRC